MHRRLIQFLQQENITQSAFADTTGVTRSSVSHILSGRNKPGFDFLESIALHYPSLNLDWLVTGRGKMYNSNDTPQRPEAEVPAGRKISKVVIMFDDNTFDEIK